ncbi:MAG: hypothetical protein CSB48_10195 [Proteobacteria bacterium]|nr:MAG: hypothetical protein CSB48_10195 [Pseudomonadota bacterium]
MFDFLFRVDADSATGAGHLMRCVALVEGLRRRGFQIGVVGSVTDRVSRAALSVDVPVLSLADHPACNCLIIDSYLPIDTLLAPWPASLPVVLVDDEANRTSDRRMLVVSPMGNPSALAKCFPRSEVITGVESLFVREEVRQARRTRSAGYDRGNEDDYTGYRSAPKVFVTLGVSEQSPVLERITHALVELLDRAVELIVYSSASSLRLQADNLSVINQFSDRFIKVMAGQADLVVCGAGQTLIEMSYIGVPVIGVVIAPNQRDCGRLLSGLGIPVLNDLNAVENDLLFYIGQIYPQFLNNRLRPAGSELTGSSLSAREKGKEQGRQQGRQKIAQNQDQLIDRICEMLP